MPPEASQSACRLLRSQTTRRPVPYGLVSKHRPASDLKIVIESTPEFGIGADDPGSVVISCADEASARKEAKRQQGSETYGAQWSYLRLDGHQVAMRFPL